MKPLMFIAGMIGVFVGGQILGESIVGGADLLSALEQSYEIFGIGVICAWLGWRE